MSSVISVQIVFLRLGGRRDRECCSAAAVFSALELLITTMRIWSVLFGTCAENCLGGTAVEVYTWQITGIDLVRSNAGAGG